MTQKTLSPGAGSTEARKISSAERDLPTPSANDLPAEFWLHVQPDGSGEERFEYEPSGFYAVPTLYVTVQHGVEITKTFNVEMGSGGNRQINLVKPPGSGLTIADDAHDKWTSWSRKAVRP